MVCRATLPMVPLSHHFFAATECVSDHGKAACKEINGVCVTATDGYYIVTGICIAFGVLFLVGFIIPTARKLQSKRIAVFVNA